MPFGLTFDKAKGERSHAMSDRYLGQRRRPPDPRAINERFFQVYPPRAANADHPPVRGVVKTMADGTPFGRPIQQHAPLMAPLMNSPMPPRDISQHQTARKHAEHKIQASRFMAKERITLLQLGKPRALDAAKSLKWKPPVASINKPAPPSPYIGGFTRIWERNVAFPRDTEGLSMKPISTLGSRWPKTPLLDFSGSFEAPDARFPKTL